MKYLSYLLSFALFLAIQVQSQAADIAVVNGVSWELASHRKKSISNINYNLKLDIPELPDLPINSVSEISFYLNDLSENLQIDFNEKTINIERVLVNGTRQDIIHENEHIIIEKSDLVFGKNSIKIEYVAGNGALNRTPNFIYTLFVPDRMRTSFPSFDQPNLKATFDLTITIPENWETISSAPIEFDKLKDNPLATFDNGKYMLIEFPSLHIPQIQRQQLFDLKLSGVTPIIAHPERYKNVQDDVSMVSDWLEAGCIIQVDAGSILGGLGSKSKKVAEEIVKNGWCQIIGSDSHNSTNRNFCLKEALHLSKKWIGDIAGNMVSENPKAVLEGLSINTDIEYDYEKQRTLLSRLKKVIGIT